MTRIGDLIRIYREQSNISQTKLARKLGYTTGQYVSNIERGLCSVPIDKIEKLEKILDLPRHYTASALVNDYKDKVFDELGIFQ